MNSFPADPNPDEGARNFRTTHWSVVLHAGDSQSSQAGAALETLCRAYWYPLYAYVRRRGYQAHDAQDLTQEFFSRLLEKKALGTVDRNKGKFRSFLLASLNHFLANEWDKTQRLKRGGGATVFSLDAEPAEERYKLEPLHQATPEKIFERRWAETVLEQVVARLREEFSSGGQEARFEVLKDFLLGEPAGVSYADAAARLAMSVSSVTSAIHRFRARFREAFRAEIANTVTTPGEVDEEIRHLVAALSF